MTDFDLERAIHRHLLRRLTASEHEKVRAIVNRFLIDEIDISELHDLMNDIAAKKDDHGQPTNNP